MREQLIEREFSRTLRKIAAFLLSSLVLFVICTPIAQAQDWAKAKLEKSPRHLEWIDVKNGDRTLKCFIAYPESKKPATAVLVIHEIFGLSDWVREVCDDLASNGFIAIAPDLLSGKPGEDTTTYKSVDDVRKAVSSLPREQVASDLKVVADYLSHLPACNGKLALAGFCWGGTQTWLAMVSDPSLKAGFVFYGSPSASANEFDKIKAPVYGFYGEKDARVTSTVDDTKAGMKKASKVYEPVIYSNAGHGFMRSGEAPDAEPPNMEARKEGWARMLRLLQKL